MSKVDWGPNERPVSSVRVTILCSRLLGLSQVCSILEKTTIKKTFRTEDVQGTCMVVVCGNKSMFSELASSLLKINDFQNMYAEL